MGAAERGGLVYRRDGDRERERERGARRARDTHLLLNSRGRLSYLWWLWAEPLKCVAPVSGGDGSPWQDSLVLRLREPAGFLFLPCWRGRRGRRGREEEEYNKVAIMTTA